MSDESKEVRIPLKTRHECHGRKVKSRDTPPLREITTAFTANNVGTQIRSSLTIVSIILCVNKGCDSKMADGRTGRNEFELMS